MTLGGATKDIFIHCKESASLKAHKDDNHCFMLIEEGVKIEVNSLHYASGGGATNSAASFKHLGFDVSTFFQIGDDEAGEFVMNDLVARSIDVSMVVKTSLHKTGISFIFPSITNNRSIFAYRGANAVLAEENVPFDYFHYYHALYITSLSGESSKLLPMITKRAKQQGLFVATNPGTSQLTSNPKAIVESLAFIDVFTLNLNEAQTFFSTLSQQGISKKNGSMLKNMQAINHNFPLLDYLVTILHNGPSIAVVTNGAEGVYIATQDSLYFHKSLSIETVNTVGAGDAFGSSFVAALLQEKSIEQAIVQGIVNSASVICHEDAKQGLLSDIQLEKQLQQLGTHGVQKCNFG